MAKSHDKEKGGIVADAWTLSADEQRLPGANLLGALLHMAYKLSLSMKALAEDKLGMSKTYFYGLRSGASAIPELGEQYISSIAEFLQVPKITVRLLAEQVTVSEFATADLSVASAEIRRALSFLQSDPSLSVLSPRTLNLCDIKVQLFLISLYQRATHTQLLSADHMRRYLSLASKLGQDRQQKAGSKGAITSKRTKSIPGLRLIDAIIEQGNRLGYSSVTALAKASLGITPTYFAMLRSGARPIPALGAHRLKNDRPIVRPFERAATFLGVSVLEVRMLADEVTIADFYSDPKTVSAGRIKDAVKSLAKDRELDLQMPQQLMTETPEIQHYAIILYEMATNKTLLQGRFTNDEIIRAHLVVNSPDNDS